jgi:hypothetical protein
MFPIIPALGFCSLKDWRLAAAVASPELRFWFIRPENMVPELEPDEPWCLYVNCVFIYRPRQRKVGKGTERNHTLRFAEVESPPTLFAGVGVLPEPPLTADILPVDDAIVERLLMIRFARRRMDFGMSCKRDGVVTNV